MNLEVYQKAKQGLLAADLSSQTKWKMTGSDRVRYLNGQSTCDVSHLSPGKTTLGAITTIKGKLEGELRIAATADSFLLDTDASLYESLFNRLSRYIIADDVDLTDISSEWKLYHIIGTDVPESFKLQTEPPARIFPSNRYGTPGLDLWIPANATTTIPCASAEIWEALRVEGGVPRWGVDMDGSNLAPEMPFERLGGLSYSKGCYIGQEVIARIKSIGHVNKQLCLLHSIEPVVPDLPCPCVSEGKNIGTATSGTLSPASGGSSILATLARQYALPGTSIEIGGRTSIVASI